MTRSSLQLLLAPLVLLALAGCGPQDRPVAKVGDHTLTVRDLERAALGAQGMLLPPEQAKPLLLDQMVNTELLLAAVRSQGVETTAVVRNYRARMTDQALLSALTVQLSATGAGASEAEARRMWEWRQQLSDVELVYAPDSTTLRVCREELDAGRPWAEVANEFGGMGGLPPGGALGPRPPGQLPKPLDDAMRTLPVGAIGGPYRIQRGWFLVRVKSRTAAPATPFEPQAQALAELVRQRKFRQQLVNRLEELMAEYRANVDAGAPMALYDLLAPARNGQEPVAPDAAAGARVLARWTGGRYTLGNAWDDLQRNDLPKPSAAYMPSLADWLQERVLTAIAFQDARRRHLDQEPEVRDRVNDQVNDYLLKSVYGDIVASATPPTEAELREQWRARQGRTPILQQAHVAWALFADSARAVAVATHAGHGTLADAVRAEAPATRVVVELVKFPSNTPEWGPVQQRIEAMSPGEWYGPALTPDGWRVFQLVDKVQGPLDWDRLPADTKQLVAGNLIQVARQARVQAYVDSLRRAFEPVVLRDNLRYASWPAPNPVEP